MKAPVYAALALAFASFGDAFLYPFLPVNNAAAGIPVLWVGILLSINRFVRIFSNGLMVPLFAKYGLRLIMIIAVLLAILSTAGYATATGIVMWLLFRICWGLSFSAMRIGTFGYALHHSAQGLALGVSRGIQEAGPMLALFFAPFLLHHFNVQTIFVLLAAFSLPALYFAWKLPREGNTRPSPSTGKFLQFPSALNSITLISAMLIDGIIVIVLGILFLRFSGEVTLVTATSLAALYLGYRRVCLVALSPAGGWIADRFGADKIFNGSMACVIAGLVMLVSGWIGAGVIIIFTFYSIHAAITPGVISRNQSNALQAVAQNATWRDIGAAAGTLAGGLLITSPYLINILIIAIFSLAILLLVHAGTAQKALKFFYQWK